MRRPALYFAVAAGLLLAAAAPVISMNIGAAGVSTLPDSLVSKQGFLALEKSFPAAGSDPARIVVQGDARRRRSSASRRTLAGDADVRPPTVERGPRASRSCSVPVVGRRALRPGRGGGASASAATTSRPRSRAPTPTVLVGGTTAENIDYFDVMKNWLPLVLVFVLGLSFVLLTVAFRSIVIAGTAILLNLLSVGATYGLLVLVFQHGIGTGLLGFQQVDIVEAWVPLFLFAVLFGLSMDYQVFLLSRIRERYTQTGDTTDAIEFGITSTARIITGAALIIVAVFLGFAMGELVMFQQMGFGIAIALLIDATIVRSVLVPAAMTMLGSWNWYLPTLARLAAPHGGRGRLRGTARAGRASRARLRARPRPRHGGRERGQKLRSPTSTTSAGMRNFRTTNASSSTPTHIANANSRNWPEVDEHERREREGEREPGDADGA